ncbi:hypothetical protein SLS59_001226 [Nothophoma quercina]|uniref:Uncharacterized protein n=1 Tax=Nothophoma quercina TaxID=749835 RepID=A0ABR3S0E4_9PLEO
MSDTEGAKGKAAGSGWTDRERLAYLVSLIEHSDTKFNFKTAPLPVGRTAIACERMVGRLKNTLKAELEALKAGQPMPADGDTPKATPKKTPTPRKRKGKEDGAEANGDAEGSPKKRGRPKKAAEPKPAAAENDEEAVKTEVKEEGEAEEV